MKCKHRCFSIVCKFYAFWSELEIRIFSLQGVKQIHMYIYAYMFFFHSYVIVLIALVNLFWISSKDTLRARNIDTPSCISLDKYSAHCQYRKCFVRSFSIFEIRQMKKQHISANGMAAGHSRHVACSMYLFGRVLIHHAYVLCRHVRASSKSDPPFRTHLTNFLIRSRVNPCA